MSGLVTWTEMEERLGQICWLDKLNTPTCRSLWRKVEGILAEYWAHQVREAALDWDRKGPLLLSLLLGEGSRATRELQEMMPVQ